MTEKTLARSVKYGWRNGTNGSIAWVYASWKIPRKNIENFCGGSDMTQLRKDRNVKIKRAVTAELQKGLSLKEALYVVADRWYLSKKHVERIYYETIID